MLFHYFFHDCQPQTGAFGLGRHVRLEGARQHALRKTRAVIFDAQLNLSLMQRGAQHYLRLRDTLKHILRILQQVMNDLAQAGCVPIDLAA